MRRHLLLLTFTLILSHFSILNLWAGEQYIFPVTSASTGSGGILGTDANGMWYYEITDAGDYIDIPFTVDQSREYLIYVGYTTAVSGAELRLSFYRYDTYIAAFGNHGVDVASTITEKNCGAQLNTGYIDGCKPYKLRVQPVDTKTIRVYYLKVVSNDAVSQSTASITAADLNFVATTTTGDQIVTNSDFLYSHKKEDRVKTQNKGGYDRTTFTNGYVTAASRKLYTFETGTYKFTFDVFTEEKNTYYKPYVFVNNVVAGGGSYYFDKDDGSAGGNYRNWEVEIDVTEGTYPIAFFFPNSNEKLFYRLASVEKKAVSCPSYTFHYGTTGQEDWVTPLCFTQVGATTEWQLTDFVIPNKPNWYVGYQGNFKSGGTLGTGGASSSTTDWATTMYLAKAMDVLDESGTPKVGSSAAGAKGTIRIYSNWNWNNLDAAFIPDGYGITYGGTGHAFTETATSDMWETDYLTLPDVSSKYYMGMETETEGEYVKYGKSRSPDEAISAMDVTIKEAGKKKILLVPGSFAGAGAQYAVYDVTNSAFDTDFMKDPDGDGVYEGYVGADCAAIILCRMSNTATTSDLSNKNWDARWNQTANIGIGDLLKKYTITSLNGNNCAYTTTDIHPATGDKGKFRMWANSKADNWFVHWIPYYTLSYDGNGGSGSTAPTVRNCESSTLTVSVASNGFTAPTGYEFAGWNTLAGGGGDSYAAGASYTLTSNATLYAVWEPRTYDVTLHTNGGTINAGNVTSYTYGTGATLPTNVTKTGYDFGGWYDNSGLTDDRVYSIANNVTGNKEYWAKWTAKQTTITIDANTTYHGSTGSSVTATWGSALPSFTAASGASGYGLVGYYTGANDGTKVINADGTLVQNVTGYTSNDATPVWIYETSTLDLYPHYEEMTTYSVTVNRNNDSYGTVTGAGSYASGATVNITATPAGGYEFVNWTTSDGVTFVDANSASTSFTMIGSTVTVTANFQAETCVSDIIIECEDDDYLIVPSAATQSMPGKYIKGNSDYYKDFNGKYIEHKSEANNGYTGEMYYLIRIPKNASYTFTVRVGSNKNQYFNLYSTDGTYDASKYVTYGGVTYYKKQAGVAVGNSSSESDHYFRDVTACTISLSAGNYVIGLYGEGWATWDQIKIHDNSTYTVSYNATGAATGSTISAAASGSGLASGSSVSACTEVTFTADPADGYEVEHWQVGGVTYAAFDGMEEFTLAINRNVTVTYTTVGKTYTVTLDNAGATTTAGSSSVTMTYGSDSHTAITNPAQSGYTFDGWYTGEGGTGTLVINSSGVLQNSTAYTDGSGNWNYDGEPTLYAGYTVEGGGGGDCDITITSTEGYTSDNLTLTVIKLSSTQTQFILSAASSTLRQVNLANANVTDWGSGTGLQVADIRDGWTVVDGTLEKTVTWTIYPSGPMRIYLVPYRDNSQGGSDIMGGWFDNIDASCEGGGTTYTVTYNANGADDGDVPVDAFSPYLEDATVTVMGNKHGMTKTGYIFDGWNTAADGSGTSYAANATFEITEDVTLYAKWKINANVNAGPSGYDNCKVFAVHTSGDEYSPIGMILANWGGCAASGAEFEDGSGKKAYQVNTNTTNYAGLYFGSTWTGTPTTLCDASSATKLHIEFYSPTAETFDFDVLSYYGSANHDGTAQSVTVTAGTWEVKDFDLSVFGDAITGHKNVLSGFKVDYGAGVTGKELLIANVYFYKPGDNLAIGATATAGRETLDANYAVDGNASTRWGSEGGNANQHWITVDLKQLYTVSTVKLSWETACPKNYYIKGSLDGTNFYPLGHYTVVPTTGGEGQSIFTTYDIESGVEARYLQMYSVENNTGWGTSIWEFEAYGSCASNVSTPIITFAEVQHIALSTSGARAFINVGAWDDATAFGSLTYKVVFTAGKEETLTGQTATDGVLTLSGLTAGTTYTVKIYAYDGTNYSENYKELSFTPNINLYYLTSDATGAAGVWEGGLSTSASADARRFAATAHEGIYRFYINASAAEVQYRPYCDVEGDITYRNDGDHWSGADNQVVSGHNGETIEVYAKDKDHFVSVFDELKVYGAAIVGATTEGTAKTMTYNGDHTFSWEGEVASGTNGFRIVVNNNHSSITDNSRARIMDAAEDWTNGSGWGYAKLTFDMTTWEYEWTEADTFIFDNNEGSGDGKWSTASNWMNNALPTIDKNVIIRAEVEVDITNARAKSVVIDQIGSNTGQLVLGAGNELVVATTVRKTTDGETYGATDENDIVFNSDASHGLGALVMGSHDGTNKATVNFYTLSHGSSGSDRSVNQYVGTPFNDETNILYNWYNSWVYGIVYDGSGNIGWGRVNEGQGMTPFKGYTVISADPAGHSYWQQGTLNATTNQTISGLNWQSGSGAANENNENLLANSWMAPIKIAAMQSTDFVRTDATIYIFNSTSPNDYKLGGFASNYTTYTVGTAGTTDIIPAMQSFSVFTNASGGSSVTLDYSKIVYDPAVAGTVPAANRAPQRRTSAEEANKLRLFVSAESGYGDMVYMWERSDFAEGFENGWDGRKVFGEPVAPQLYAVTPDGNMAVNCVPDFEGTLLGFQAGTSANSYTFTFEYTDEAEELYLRDMDTNAFTRVMNGNSYTFTTSDRTSHNRFVLTKNAPQSPTDIAETGDGLPVTGARKVIINDHVYILRGGRMYSIEGRVVKSE